MLAGICWIQTDAGRDVLIQIAPHPNPHLLSASYPYLGSMEANMKLLSAVNPELSELFQDWSRSENSRACFAYCQDSDILTSTFLYFFPSPFQTNCCVS